MSLETSASERKEGKKEGRLCVSAVQMCLLICGVGNWPLIVVVLFIKNVAKSSAVMVD